MVDVNARRQSQREFAKADVAFKCLKVQDSADNLIDFWADFCGHWRTSFVTARTSTRSGTTKKWSDQLEHEVRSDVVLQYVRQSRNASTYVEARPISKVVPPSFITGSPSYPSIVRAVGNPHLHVFNNRVVTLGADGGIVADEALGDLEVRPNEIGSAEVVSAAFPARKVSHYLELLDITNRSTTFPAPHLTGFVEENAFEVGKHALEWLREKQRQLSDFGD